MTFTNFNDLSSLNNQVITTNSMFQKKLLEFKNYSNIDTTISFEYSIAVSKNSVVVEYVNENERNLIETIRSFNKTQGIKQLINIYLASIPTGSVLASMHFDDIVRNFRASRLDNDKNSVISRLPFIQYVRNLPFDISIYLTDPDVVSISSFYIYFNMPYEFGRNSDIVIIDTYEFISFLSFLNVYSIQCGLVMMLHQMFKSRVSKSTEILFKNSFHFNVLSKDSRVYQLNFNGFDDKIYNIDISKMYSKFFAGCGCRRESF